MSDKKPSDLPFGSDERVENELWNTLGRLELPEPSADLRLSFFKKLEQSCRATPITRLRGLLGFSDNMGWLTATACLLVGIGAGQMLRNSSGDEAERLVALEQNVSMLNRTLILDRLENVNAGKRLRGVLDAAYMADDTEIANALLQRATEDRVHSIRAAAIDTLGLQIGRPNIGQTIMDSIVEAESPLVQLALVDLVLRNGTQQQIDQLLELARGKLLFPDLSQHVLNSLGSNVA